MKQKIVVKVQMRCGKCRKKAMKIAASAEGVISVAIQGNDKDEIVVIGNRVDSAGLCTALRRKLGDANLVSVEEIKDPKPEEKKKDEKPEEKKPAAATAEEKKVQKKFEIHH
ncbi:heavy metal-associated isoprenylated plant protein 47-like [Chenopodium quinoa]|uniref:heavy metal-associated isoprenylated plant protein 47-like n=1 Tax=Chenopodium quinoa TaxID=63459 RepID=UPI000B778B5D|nr:heavy metal-associated isoprenylated plant protein 47-like [Chenopodium quinoa]